MTKILKDHEEMEIKIQNDFVRLYVTDKEMGIMILNRTTYLSYDEVEKAMRAYMLKKPCECCGK